MSIDATTFTDFLNNYLIKITSILNTQTSKANTLIGQVTNSNLAEITDLTNQINLQNQQIDKQITKVYSTTHGVKDINTKYEQADLELMVNYNYKLLIIYYIFVFIFSFILFYFRQTTIYKNIGILLLFIIYPFIMIYIEVIIYIIYEWIYVYITKSPLTSNIYIQNNN
jgi:hypothetical protein